MNTKRIILTLLAAFCMGIGAFAVKNSVSFNVMLSDKKAEKKMISSLKAQQGVKSVKSYAKEGAVTVFYESEETNIAAITAVFRSAGIFATPIGENCSVKKGGCLNNAPTTINTMR